MPERPTCAVLITRLRVLIGDKITPTAEPVWSDAELQDALDSRREFVDAKGLEPVGSYVDSAYVYLSFEAPYGDWEEDAILTDGSGATVTPTSADYLAGRWTFAAQPSYPLYLTGATYCLYGAAADLLDMWSATKPEFDFKSKDRSFSRSQLNGQRGRSAETYRRRARPVSATMIRTDVNHSSGCGRSDYERMLRR